MSQVITCPCGKVLGVIPDRARPPDGAVCPECWREQLAVTAELEPA